MTNVKPSELNYDKYTSSRYDRDIINAIPYHKELHEHIVRALRKKFYRQKEYRVLDLGVGTGITAQIVRRVLPNARLDMVDFSRQMLAGARKRLGTKNTKYLLGDYMKMKFPWQYDLVIAVIGVHHQDTAGKKWLFKKIYSLLKPGGIFIFGDLVTYKNPRTAARNNALHYHHLVEHTASERSLTEWAHHHMFLNDLAPIENQMLWLSRVGFKVKKDFCKMNTALLICERSRKKL